MLELAEPKDDGYVTISVGEWSRKKHHFLHRYIDAFTTAMKEKRWMGLHYIDLFAGPGMLRLKESGDLIWGSPLIAAQCPLFSSLHLCDKNSEYTSALERRIRSIGAEDRVTLYTGDANVEVREVVKRLPPKSLSLAFLDPFGLHLHFSTLQTLAERRIDLIIFFPDYLDALRNCEHFYHDKPDSNLDKVLGSSADWRGLLDQTPRDRWAQALCDLYVEQIKGLGYSEFEFERVSNRKMLLYRLIFCSHHAAGSKIWRGVSGTKPDGQRTFGFD